jgi:hypothetical protein
MPFQEARPDREMPKPSNLKITNESSAVATPGPTRKQVFDKVATASHERSEEYKRRAYELGKSFVRIIEDRKLVSQKGPTAKSVEAQALNELLMLGAEMNMDETQEEGMGSIGVITLLIKGLILQRDRNNEMSYRLDQMEKNIRSLEAAKQATQPFGSVPPQPAVIEYEPNPFAPQENDPIRASRDPGKNPFEG